MPAVPLDRVARRDDPHAAVLAVRCARNEWTPTAYTSPTIRVDTPLACVCPIGSAFHQACIDRWLIESQAYHKRECPMCKANPIRDDPSTTVASTSGSSEAAALEAAEPVAEIEMESHLPPPQQSAPPPTAAVAAGEGDDEPHEPSEAPLQVVVVIEVAEQQQSDSDSPLAVVVRCV